jgi:DNA-binding beta-propeller fold protein YncE
VHGFAVAADLGKGFASNGRENKAAIVDLKTLQILSSVATGDNPDAILYEPAHKEVYTFNGNGKSATVFDAATGIVKTTIPLPGKPEFAVVDVKAGRIYNNIEDMSTLVVIDTATHKIVNTWPIAPGEEASGLAIDLAHHRLFIGCSNNMMVMMDSTSGKVLGSVSIGEGVDANAFDPGTGYAFASSSDGTLTVASVDAAGKLTVVQKLATPERTRTMTLDPVSHRLYAAAAEYKPGAPGADGKPPARPTMVPGSFKVMVYELVK